jgi:transcriptional regulator with XRE-family HTH domain
MAKEELVNRRIGKTIARKRKIAGFTQEEVAEHLGIGNDAFSRIERGLVSPGIYKLYQLADLFKCGVETFLIEASKRPTDQAEYISQMLAKNSVADRQVLVSVLERLSRHMLRKIGGKKEADENFLV